VQVQTTEQLDEIAARIEQAGIALERDGDGFFVRDPWGITLRVEVAA
jgi:hypothetical protein